MQKTKTFFTRCKILTLYSVVTVLVLVAVSLTVIRVFIPDLGDRREYIESQLGTLLERPVYIEEMDARLVGLSPTLIFKNVRMLKSKSKNELIKFSEIRVSVSVFDSIAYQKFIPKNLTVSGLELRITRLKNGKFQVQGLGVDELGSEFVLNAEDQSSELSDWLFHRSSLIIQDSTVIWHDIKAGQKPRKLHSHKLSLRNQDDRHQFTGGFTLPEKVGKNVVLAFDVYGDILDPVKWKGNFYIHGDAVAVNEWGLKPDIKDVAINEGLFDVKMWGIWDSGKLKELKALIEANNLLLTRQTTNKTLKVNAVSGQLAWKSGEKDWYLRVNNFNFIGQGGKWPETDFRFASFIDESNNKTFRAELDFIRIQDVQSVLDKTDYFSRQQSDLLNRLKPQGDIKNLHFQLQTEGDKSNYAVTTEFDGVSVEPYKKIPGITGAKGYISAGNNSGGLTLDSENVVAKFPRIFERNIGLSKLKGRINWKRNTGHWVVTTKNLEIINNDFKTISTVSAHISEKHPESIYLDLQTSANDVDGKQVRNYMPVSVMKPKLISWLRTAINSGTASDGFVVFNGRVKNFPFRDKPGTFKASFNATNVEIDYQKNWPKIYDAKLSAMFTSRDMHLDVHHAKMLQSKTDHMVATIKDFKSPEVSIDGLVKAKLTDIATYLTTTPMLPQAKDFVDAARFVGAGDLKVHLHVPLDDEVKKHSPLGFRGHLDVENVHAFLVDGKLDVENITGRWNFSDKKQYARNITANIQRGKTIIDGYTRMKNGARQLELIMRGNIEIARMMKKFNMPGYDHIHGNTDWKGAFTFRYKDKNNVIHPAKFKAVSDLKQIESTLPSPMSKPADSTLPTFMELTLVEKGRIESRVKFGEKLSAAMDVSLPKNGAKLLRGEFALKDADTSLPEKNIMRVSGTLLDFSLRDWLEALDTTRNAKNQPFLGIPIYTDMDRVQFKKDNYKKPRPPSPPRTLPLMDAKIGQLEFDNIRFGKTTFYTTKIENGLRINDFNVNDENLVVQGIADWTYVHGQHLTVAKGILKSDNFGQLLGRMGFASAIENGAGEVQGVLKWPGSPGSFALKRLNGEIKSNITDGRFLKVEAGAGRLLGLLSITALPRRLLLDFRDTFKSGFSFDFIKGDVHVLEGNAYTEDMKIISPVATVNITGRTGLSEKDFDQYVTVIPQVSDSLALPSGLLFGAQIGAIVLFFRQLFGDDVDESIQRIYHISGNWDKPVIKQLNADKPDTPQTQDPIIEFSEEGTG